MPANRSVSLAIALFSDWLDEVQYKDYVFKLSERGGCIYLQATFTERCARTGKAVATQHTRQWMLHPDMTRSEVIQTALKLVLTSEEHEARENFKYRGKAIFGPHFDVDFLHTHCNDASLEHRGLKAA